MSSRVSRRDWVDVGIALLREEGSESITVEALCTRIGRTKGSFYHHFPDIDALGAALLEAWEATLTDAPLEAVRAEPDVRRRGARLDALVQQLDHRLDRAVRAWALRNPRARLAVQRVDARRVGYLEELHRAAKHRAPRALAELEYAAFVGAQHLDVFADGKRAAALGKSLREALKALGAPP